MVLRRSPGVPLGVEGHAFYLLGLQRLTHRQASWDVLQHSWCLPQAQEQEDGPSTHPTPRLTFLSADRQPREAGLPSCPLQSPGSTQVRATVVWWGWRGLCLGSVWPSLAHLPRAGGGKVTDQERRRGRPWAGAPLTLARPCPRGLRPRAPSSPLQYEPHSGSRGQKQCRCWSRRLRGTGPAEAGRGVKIAQPDRRRLAAPVPAA